MKNVNAMEGARYRDSIIEIPSVEDIERKPKHTQRCSPKKLPVPTLTLVKWMVKSVVTFENTEKQQANSVTSSSPKKA